MVPLVSSCPVTRAWRILGKPWRIVIVDRLLTGPKTFKELMNSMPGISSRTLSKALKELRRAGIVERVCDGKRHYYALTDAGRDLKAVIKAIRVWSEKWIPDSEITGSRESGGRRRSKAGGGEN